MRSHNPVSIDKSEEKIIFEWLITSEKRSRLYASAYTLFVEVIHEKILSERLQLWLDLLRPFVSRKKNDKDNFQIANPKGMTLFYCENQNTIHKKNPIRSHNPVSIDKSEDKIIFEWLITSEKRLRLYA